MSAGTRNPVTGAKKRKIMLVIEDGDGPDQFSFTMQGDVERIGSQEVGLVPTAAEHWAIELMKVCQDRLKQGAEVKKLNRQERRGGIVV